MILILISLISLLFFPKFPLSCPLRCVWFACVARRRPEAPPVPHRDTSASPPPLPPRCQPPLDSNAAPDGGGNDPVACFPLFTTCINGLQLQLVSCFPPELLTEADPRKDRSQVDGGKIDEKSNRRYSAPPSYLVPML